MRAQEIIAFDVLDHRGRRRARVRVMGPVHRFTQFPSRDFFGIVVHAPERFERFGFGQFDLVFAELRMQHEIGEEPEDRVKIFRAAAERSFAVFEAHGEIDRGGFAVRASSRYLPAGVIGCRRTS